jgi:hypothetical protein
MVKDLALMLVPSPPEIEARWTEICNDRNIPQAEEYAALHDWLVEEVKVKLHCEVTNGTTGLTIIK